MVPAQQRLGGDDRAVGKADLRLIDERELVALDRAAQIDLELRAIGKLVRERLAELFDPAAPMPLRLIHRRVGGAHQPGQRGAVARGQRDPQDRKSGVWGKSVSRGVELGGRRSIEKTSKKP